MADKKEEKEKLSASETVGFLRKLGPRVRPYRLHLLASGVLILLGTAIGLAFPLIVRNLLDAAFLEESGRLLNLIAVGLLLLFCLDGLISFSLTYLTASVSERIVADLRLDLFTHLVHLPPGFFESRRVGELGSRFSSDIGRIQDVIRFGVPQLARQGLYLAGALVLVTMTDPRLTLVTLVAIPAAGAVAVVFGKKVRRLSTGIQDTLASAVGRADQVFTQIRTVQSFNRQEDETTEFSFQVGRIRDVGIQRAMARAIMVGAVSFAAFASVVLVLWEGGRLVLAGELTPGTLVAFLLYAVTIAGAIASLAGFWSNLQEAAGSAKRVFELLDEERSIGEPRHPYSIRRLRGRVRYEDVWFRYGPEQPWVLKGVNMELVPGLTVALVGVSGAGKSTLAGLLPRFFDVQAGRVTVDRIDVRDLPLGQLREMIGVVPQEPMLFAGSIRENLLYARRDATLAEMRDAARMAHAYEFIMGLPNGFDEVIGERGVTLSAGQRQRIAIARIFLKRPKILLLDEASSALDSESETLVQDALSRLMSETTTLVIAHRLSTILAADRIMVLDEGRIRAKGTHLELLERSSLYRRLYQRQWESTTGVTADMTEAGPIISRIAHGSHYDRAGSPFNGVSASDSLPDTRSSTHSTGTDGIAGAIPRSNQA